MCSGALCKTHHSWLFSLSQASLPAGYNMDDGYLEAVVGAVIATVVLVLLVVALVVVRYMFRHKGSYQTNEAKGTEFADTADAALRGDPAIKDAVDQRHKEYFV
uniref:Glycophorin C (Gerbich blood group) n=1 Tax=Neogobius melanostomus TaxID=47308 RepID=A0A8C6UU43_9GOBI